VAPELQLPVDVFIAALAAWPLVCHDDFTGVALNPQCWVYETQRSGNDPVRELQRFVPESTVRNGVLSITARKRRTDGESGPKEYVSAQIYSKTSFRYGRFEARIKVPDGAGFWPTFWLLLAESVYGAHPRSGEIDIMEMIGRQPNDSFAVAHYYDFAADKHRSAETHKTTLAKYSAGFHVYALEWRPGRLTWLLDGKPFFTTTKWTPVPGKGPGSPFDQPFRVVLNLSVGGIWGGPPTPQTRFPAALQVDYVRIYSPEPARDPC
jgi:beta-glucanase (GH16 family)